MNTADTVPRHVRLVAKTDGRVNRFRYAAPETVEEVVELLSLHGEGARLLAGGQSLMILMRNNLLAPDVVVSLKRVAHLDSVTTDNGTLEIGAMTTYRSLSRSETVRRHAPMLARAASAVGSEHIRNLGTIGGSVCHADPSGDVPVALLALGASIVATSASGPRETPISTWFKGLFEVALQPNELATAISLPKQGKDTSFGYSRFSYREGEYPMVVVAAVLEWNDTRCASARIAIGGAASRPLRVAEVEVALRDTEVGPSDVAAAASALRAAIDPPDDVRGSGAWRRGVAVEYLGRALASAVDSRGSPRD